MAAGSGSTTSVKPLGDKARFFRVIAEGWVRIRNLRRGAGSLRFDIVPQ
jgi:hypothetical protein